MHSIILVMHLSSKTSEKPEMQTVTRITQRCALTLYILIVQLNNTVGTDLKED